MIAPAVQKVLRLRLPHREEGQSIITLALAMLFFMSLLAVIGDTLFVYWQRRDLQNTADAAALAGAQQLPLDAAAAEADAEQWALENISDLAADKIEPQVFTTAFPDDTIRVTVKKNAKSSAIPRSPRKQRPRCALGNCPARGLSLLASATARIPMLPGPASSG
jgi:Flp pilus assembly protein TadG